MSTSERYYEPFKGSHFKRGDGTLILSESAYKWTGRDEKSYFPRKTHPTTFIEWATRDANFFKRTPPYFNAVTRALCGAKYTSRSEGQAAWDQVAYSIYVQNRMTTLHVRPRKADWDDAKLHFMPLLEELRPKRVIVTGITAWRKFKDCALHCTDRVQAFEISGKEYVWCLALKHPRSGFNFAANAEVIRRFRSYDFPRKLVGEEEKRNLVKDVSRAFRNVP